MLGSRDSGALAFRVLGGPPGPQSPEIPQTRGEHELKSLEAGVLMRTMQPKVLSHQNPPPPPKQSSLSCLKAPSFLNALHALNSLSPKPTLNFLNAVISPNIPLAHRHTVTLVLRPLRPDKS